MPDHRKNFAVFAMAFAFTGAPMPGRDLQKASYERLDWYPPKPDPALRDQLRARRAARNLRRLARWLPK